MVTMRYWLSLVVALGFLTACESAAGASKRVLVDGSGARFTLAIPERKVSGPISVGPLYNSTPKNPLLYFKPNAEFLAGKTNVPTLIPIRRK